MRHGYFDTPNAAVAISFKVGSATLARAIIAAYYPDIDGQMRSMENANANRPDGNQARWQGRVPKVNPMDRPVTLVMVRNPVDKFQSACRETRVQNIDTKLDALESAAGNDPHFWPQARLLAGNSIKLYRFPRDFNALATEAGLTLPLPNIDGGRAGVKPVLTERQIERVRAIYAADITLFDSITEAGQSIPVPPPYVGSSLERTNPNQARNQARNQAHAAKRRARQIACESVCAQFRDLPAWVRGPLHRQLEDITSLLDKGDDEAAAAVLAYADTPQVYSVTQKKTLATASNALRESIKGLPVYVEPLAPANGPQNPRRKCNRC